MYELIFGGVLTPSDEQLACFLLGVGLLLAFPIRWILNFLLKNSVICWSFICLFIAVGMFLCNLFFCIYFYQALKGNPILLADPPTALLSVALCLNPLCAYTLAYIFFDGSRWKRRCSKCRFQLIYHLNTPFQISLIALTKSKTSKIRNIYMGRYVAARVFVVTFWINFLSFFGLFLMSNPTYIWLMMLINAISLPSTIYAFIVAIRKGERWFFNIDEYISRKGSCMDIDKYTNIGADGEDAEWSDEALKNLD